MIQKSPNEIAWERISKYFPSKKVTYIILGTLGLIGSIYIVSSLTRTGYDSKLLSVKTVGDAIVKDSDSDGVPDWEEDLWGTNPYKSDTDGDGVPDGTEIAERKGQIASSGGYASSSGSMNETDKFSRDLFITYSAISQEGTLSESASEKLASAAIAKSFEKIPVVPTYSKTDLKLIPTTKTSDLEYRKSVTKLSQVGGGTLGTEFALINNGIENEDVAKLRQASKNASVYRLYISSLIKLPVPESQADNHVRLLNDLSYIATTLPQMADLENDIIKGYPLYTIYTKAYQDMFLTFEAIGKSQFQ